MAKVIKKGKRYVVVNSKNLIPVGKPNTYPTMARAKKRASQIRCKVLNKC